MKRTRSYEMDEEEEAFDEDLGSFEEGAMVHANLNGATAGTAGTQNAYESEVMMIVEMLGDSIPRDKIVAALRRNYGDVSLAMNDILDSGLTDAEMTNDKEVKDVDAGAKEALVAAPTTKITLDQVIMEQHANGSWDATALQKFGFPAGTAPASVPASVPADVWATLVVLALLEARFPDSADEWKPIKAKSLRWVAKSAASSFSLQELCDAAKAFVKSVLKM